MPLQSCRSRCPPPARQHQQQQQQQHSPPFYLPSLHKKQDKILQKRKRHILHLHFTNRVCIKNKTRVYRKKKDRFCIIKRQSLRRCEAGRQTSISKISSLQYGRGKTTIVIGIGRLFARAGNNIYGSSMRGATKQAQANRRSYTSCAHVLRSKTGRSQKGGFSPPQTHCKKNNTENYKSVRTRTADRMQPTAKTID